MLAKNREDGRIAAFQCFRLYAGKKYVNLMHRTGSFCGITGTLMVAYSCNEKLTECYAVIIVNHWNLGTFIVKFTGNYFKCKICLKFLMHCTLNFHHNCTYNFQHQFMRTSDTLNFIGFLLQCSTCSRTMFSEIEVNLRMYIRGLRVYSIKK